MTSAISNYYAQINQWCKTHNATAVYKYKVPLLGEGGTCSLFGELDETPFQLTNVLNESQLSLVPAIQAVVDWVQQNTEVEWFGVYLKTQEHQEPPTLTKMAYFGAASRAQFPLTEEFAKISNNAMVGLTGQGKTINNVACYLEQGGEYYTCDPKVKSELCWPIIAQSNLENKTTIDTSPEQKILGIIDAESFKTDCFDDNHKAIFTAVCKTLSEIMSSL